MSTLFSLAFISAKVVASVTAGGGIGWRTCHFLLFLHFLAQPNLTRLVAYSRLGIRDVLYPDARLSRSSRGLHLLRVCPSLPFLLLRLSTQVSHR
jgi:hypothetical protein